MGMHDVDKGSAGSSKIIIRLYLNILIGKNKNSAISKSGNDAPFLSLLRFAREVENRMEIALFYLIVCWIADGKCISVARQMRPSNRTCATAWMLDSLPFIFSRLVYVMRQTHNQTNMSFKKINILVYHTVGSMNEIGWSAVVARSKNRLIARRNVGYE